MPDPTQPHASPRSSSAATPRRDGDTDDVAEALERRGLAAPAAILMDAHRPLLPVLRQAALFLAPFAGPLLGRKHVDGLRAATTEADAYDRLATRLSRGPGVAPADDARRR